MNATTTSPWLRSLGTTGITVSAIGLGTVKLGRNRDVKYPQPFSLPDDKQARRLLDCARDLGINVIDTAPAYGDAEQRLGQLLRGQREHWVICSKVGEQWSSAGSRFDFSSKAVRTSVENSLRTLGCEVLDIALVHCGHNDLDIIRESDALQTLGEMRRQGMIRAVGVSSRTVAGGLAAAKLCDVLMLGYSSDDRSQAQVLDACEQHGCGVLLKKVLSSGALQTAEQRRQSLRQALAHPATGSAVVGTINGDHLMENVAAARHFLGLDHGVS